MPRTTPPPGGVPGPSYGPHRLLTPTQRFVYDILLGHPYGACRRTFASVDVFEVANRISEIEDRLGITIQRERCTAHPHKRRIISYRL